MPEPAIEDVQIELGALLAARFHTFLADMETLACVVT